MQADTFLKCLLCDEAKNGKGSLLFNFSFFMTSHENQELVGCEAASLPVSCIRYTSDLCH